MFKPSVFLNSQFTILLISSNLLAFDLQHLKSVESDVVEVVKNVLPCTVGLGSPDQPQSGSGVIVSSDGLILTAAHVTSATGDILEIFFADGSQARARALGSNFDRDAGFAKIIDKGVYPFVEIGRSGNLIENQWCVAIGHPGGFQPDRTAPIRLGRVISKSHNKFVRTDCTLIGGDSGGPLFDLDGKLIGIHSNIGASLSENNHIPVDVFRQNWDRLLKGERWGRLPGSRKQNPNRAVMGIRPRGSKDGGLLVEVAPEGAAEKAGMKTGDIIMSIEGTKLPNVRALTRYMRKQKAGNEVSVVVKRDKKEQTLKIKLVRAKDLYSPKKEQVKIEIPADLKAAVILKQKPAYTESELDEKIRDIVKLAKADQSTIDITPETLRQFHGKDKLTERLNRLFDQKETKTLLKGTFSKYRGRSFFKNLVNAYGPAVDPVRVSVAPVLRRDRRVALAIAVSDDGLFLTKSSEVKGRRVEIQTDPQTRHVAVFVKDFPIYDLALMKVDAKTTPIQWYNSKQDPPLGTFIAAAGTNKEPVAIGVISVQERSLNRDEKPFLGLTVKTASKGLQVTSVVKSSTAGKMKLQKGDIILSMDGVRHQTEVLFIRALLAKKPGDRIRLEVNRDGRYMGKIGKLGHARKSGGHEMRGYPQGGRLSTNRSDYPNALQTDLPLKPQDCGSPLIDLDGRAIGINIARAGRIKSYAITAEAIQELIQSL